VLAGFVKDDEAGRARVRFVTEGEASLHFSIRNGLPDGAMEVRTGFPTCDKGCLLCYRKEMVSLLSMREEERST